MLRSIDLLASSTWCASSYLRRSEVVNRDRHVSMSGAFRRSQFTIRHGVFQLEGMMVELIALDSVSCGMSNAAVLTLRTFSSVDQHRASVLPAYVPNKAVMLTPCPNLTKSLRTIRPAERQVHALSGRLLSSHTSRESRTHGTPASCRSLKLLSLRDNEPGRQSWRSRWLCATPRLAC